MPSSLLSVMTSTKIVAGLNFFFSSFVGLTSTTRLWTWALATAGTNMATTATKAAIKNFRIRSS